MWNQLTKKQLALIPKLYSQENVKDPKVYAKFFIGALTWYTLEYNPVDGTMFGYVYNASMPEGSELGYFNYNELKLINVRGIEVDREIHQVNPRSPKKLSVILKEDGVRQ